MAVINFFESSLTDVKETIEVENGTIHDYINEYASKLPDQQVVEVYIPDEDRTEYVPLENDSFSAIITVNGKEEGMNYLIKPEDVIEVIFLPRSDNQKLANGIGITGLILAGLGIGLIALANAPLGLTYLGVWASYANIGTAIGIGLMGTTAGTAMALAGFLSAESIKDKKNKSSKEQQSLYAINGGSNESILGKKYPFIMGKHLVNPYIIGSPYHITFNSIGKTVKKTDDSNNGTKGLTWLLKKAAKWLTKKDDVFLEHEDLGQYFTALYCVGYGPLELTDLKLGNIMLSYNRPWVNDPERKTVISGLLQGVDSTGAEKGDIINKWKNNDVRIEILQAGSKINGYGKWGSIYPVVCKEEQIDKGSILFAHDDALSENDKISYLNQAITNGYRTNTVRFSKNSPMRLEVELDMPQGYYATRDVKASDKAEAVTYYQQPPIHIAVQWRYSKADEISSNAESPNGWNTFDYEILKDPETGVINKVAPITYTTSHRQAEFLLNEGLRDKTKKPTYNKDWIGADVFRLNYKDAVESYTTSDLTDAEVKKLITDGVIKVTHKKYICLEKSQIELFDHTEKVTEPNGTKTKYRSAGELEYRYLDWKLGKKATHPKYKVEEIKESHLIHRPAYCKDKNDVKESVGKEQVDTRNVTVRTNILHKENGLWVSYEKPAQISALVNGNIMEWVGGSYHLMEAFEETKYKTKNVNVYKTWDIYKRDDYTIIELDEISKGENWDDYDYELETQKETLTYVSQDIFDNMFIGQTPYVKVEDWEDSITKDAEIITGTTLKKKNHYVSNYDAKEKDDYNINERRYVFVKEFTDEEMKKICNLNNVKSDYYANIEVRVIRLTPCYLKQSKAESKLTTAYSYQDLVHWTYLRTWQFDQNKFETEYNDAVDNNKTLPNPSDFPLRPMSEDDLDKFCYVAITLKADAAETAGSTLEQFNCIAQALAPKFDIKSKKWSPEKNENGDLCELNIEEQFNYYRNVFDQTGKKHIKKIDITTSKTNLTKDEMFDETDPDCYKTKTGTDFMSNFRNNIITEGSGTSYTANCYPFDGLSAAGKTYLNDISSMTWRLSDEVAYKYETSNTASQFIMALIGGQLKGFAKDFSRINLPKVGDLYEFCNDVTDGTLENYKLPSYLSTVCDLTASSRCREISSTEYETVDSRSFWFTNGASGIEMTSDARRTTKVIVVTSITDSGQKLSDSAIEGYAMQYAKGETPEHNILLAEFNNIALSDIYCEVLHEIQDVFYNHFGEVDSESVALLKELSNYSINAIASGCYNHIVQKILLNRDIPLFYTSMALDVIQQMSVYKGTKKSSRPIAKKSDGLLHIQYNCNGAITNEIKLENLLSNILLTGRSNLRRSDDNKYEPIIGKKNPYPLTVLDERNCTSISNSRDFSESISGFHISYIDEYDNYGTNNDYVMDDGEDKRSPTKRIDEFRLDYVTNVFQMRSLARFNLACRLFQKEMYQRTVGLIGESIAYGDLVLLRDNSLLVGTDNGRIVKVLKNDAEKTIIGFITDDTYSNNKNVKNPGCTIVQPSKTGLSRTYTAKIKPGKKAWEGYIAEVYDPDTIYFTYQNNEYVVAEPQPDESTFFSGTYYRDVSEVEMVSTITNLILFDTPVKNKEFVRDADDNQYRIIDIQPRAGVIFGEVGNISLPAVVMGIKPKGKHQFDLTLSPYNEDLYEYGEKIPYWRPNITYPVREESSFNFSQYQTISDVAETQAELLNSTQLLSADIEVPEGTKNIIPKIKVFDAVANERGIKLSVVMESGIYNEPAEITPYTFEISRGTKYYELATRYEPDKIYYRKVDDDTYVIYEEQPHYNYNPESEFSEEITYYVKEGDSYIPADPRPVRQFAITRRRTGNQLYKIEDGLYVPVTPESVYLPVDEYKGDIAYFLQNADYELQSEFVEDVQYFRQNSNGIYVKAEIDELNFSDEDTYTRVLKDGYEEVNVNQEDILLNDFFYDSTFIDNDYYEEVFPSDLYYSRSPSWNEGDFDRSTGIYYILNESETWKRIDVDDEIMQYIFRRTGDDGFPEAEDLDTWRVRVKVINQYGMRSDWYTTRIDVSNYKTWLLNPSEENVQYNLYADQYGVNIDYKVKDINKYYGNYRFEFYVKKPGGPFVKVEGNKFYFNNGSGNGYYPEAADLLDLEFQVKCFNVTTNKYYPELFNARGDIIDTTGYGTWIVNKPNIYCRVSDRSVSLVLSQPYNGGKEIYGNVRYKVSVRRYDDGTTENPIWYKPNISANPYEDENNYKVLDSEGQAVESDETYIQIMPLEGQNSNYIPVSKPADWDSSFNNYYYKKDGDFLKYRADYIPITKKPDDWETPSISNYYKLEDNMFVKLQEIWKPIKFDNENEPPRFTDYYTRVIVQKEDGSIEYVYRHTEAGAYDSTLTYYELSYPNFVSGKVYKPEEVEYLAGNCYEAEDKLQNTLYYFKVSSFNEAGESDYEIKEAIALCTSIRDLVKSNMTTKEEYVNSLNALSANIGTINQGAFGDNDNIWDLSTFIDDEGKQRLKGRFRVGNDEQYLQVEPVLKEGTTDVIVGYEVNIKSRRLTFTETGLRTEDLQTDSLGFGTFIYSEDKQYRLHITSSGIFVGKRIENSDGYRTISRFSSDDRDNLYVTNDSKSIPPQGIVLNAPFNKSRVYLFDDLTLNDETGYHPLEVEEKFAEHDSRTSLFFENNSVLPGENNHALNSDVDLDITKESIIVAVNKNSKGIIEVGNNELNYDINSDIINSRLNWQGAATTAWGLTESQFNIFTKQ